MRDSIYDRCRGHWPSILMQLGLDPKYLNRSRHQACPLCAAGTDRYLFKDWHGTGSYYCSQCGPGAGVDLIMGMKGCTFVEAVKYVEAIIGGAPLDVRRRYDPADGPTPPSPEPDASVQANKNRQLWGKAQPLTGTDVASRYLVKRGLMMKAWPAALRWIQDIPYWMNAQLVGYYPAMVARFIATDDSRSILQRTYLAEPGKKADVPEARKMMPGPVPLGGAVRLFPPAEVMGIAEGIETALAASLLHRDMPVWAALTTGAMLKFEPPLICKKLIIFGDLDEKKDGPAVAWALGHRLETRKNSIETEVRVPGTGAATHPWLRTKRDWNDVLFDVRHPGVR